MKLKGQQKRTLRTVSMERGHTRKIVRKNKFVKDKHDRQSYGKRAANPFVNKLCKVVLNQCAGFSKLFDQNRDPREMSRQGKRRADKAMMDSGMSGPKKSGNQVSIQPTINVIRCDDRINHVIGPKICGIGNGTDDISGIALLSAASQPDNYKQLTINDTSGKIECADELHQNFIVDPTHRTAAVTPKTRGCSVLLTDIFAIHKQSAFSPEYRRQLTKIRRKSRSVSDSYAEESDCIRQSEGNSRTRCKNKSGSKIIRKGRDPSIGSIKSSISICLPHRDITDKSSLCSGTACRDDNNEGIAVSETHEDSIHVRRLSLLSTDGQLSDRAIYRNDKIDTQSVDTSTSRALPLSTDADSDTTSVLSSTLCSTVVCSYTTSTKVHERSKTTENQDPDEPGSPPEVSGSAQPLQKHTFVDGFDIQQCTVALTHIVTAATESSKQFVQLKSQPGVTKIENFNKSSFSGNNPTVSGNSFTVGDCDESDLNSENEMTITRSSVIEAEVYRDVKGTPQCKQLSVVLSKIKPRKRKLDPCTYSGRLVITCEEETKLRVKQRHSRGRRRGLTRDETAGVEDISASKFMLSSPGGQGGFPSDVNGHQSVNPSDLSQSTSVSEAFIDDVAALNSREGVAKVRTDADTRIKRCSVRLTILDSDT